MHTRVQGYNQYKDDFFNKLNIPFLKGRKLLDVGCGDGSDCRIFREVYKLQTTGVDVYKDPDVGKNCHEFVKASIFHVPFDDNSFDYVFTHDVLHHVDEKHQDRKKHEQALSELRRVCKKGGSVIIIEGNRFNPLFYPHMVLMKGHNHFRQSYFMSLIRDSFLKDAVEFRFFEAHLYPPNMKTFWKAYERFMERLSPRQFLAYNVGVVTKV